MGALSLDQQDAIAVRTHNAEIKGQVVSIEVPRRREVMRRGHENDAERHKLRPPNGRCFGGCYFGIARESKAPSVRRWLLLRLRCSRPPSAFEQILFGNSEYGGETPTRTLRGRADEGM